MSLLDRIPLEALRVSPLNPRQPDETAAEFLQLKASIAAAGVAEPLVVEPTRLPEAERGGITHDVLQGGNRLLASLRLAMEMPPAPGLSPPTLPCNILAGLSEAEAREIAVATAVIKRPLHPVQEYEAFAELGRAGLGEADIAKRFGISLRGVRQRLALGDLAPAIREAWRTGDINFDAAAELTSLPDFQRQADVFAAVKARAQGWWKAGDWQRALRAAVMENRAKASNSRHWLFAGAEYRAAGGPLTEDLFEDETLIEDVPLLRQVAKAKALAMAEAFRQEHGFGAALYFEEAGDADAFQRLWRDFDHSMLTDEELAEIKALDARRDALPGWGEINAIADPAEREAAREMRRAEEQAAAEALDALEAAVELRILKRDFDAARYACAGRITGDGSLALTYGYIIPGLGAPEVDDAPERKSLPTTQQPAAKAAEPAQQEKGYSESMKARLAELMTQALAASIRAHPQLAAPLVIASLSMGGRSGCSAPIAFEGLYRLSRKDDFATTLTRISRDPEAARDLLADQAATLANLHAAQLERGGYAATFTLVEWDDTTFQQRLRDLCEPKEVFGPAPRDVMEQAVREMAMEGYKPSAPKKDMLPLVSAEAKRRGWLPPLLRTENYALLPAGNAADAAPAGKMVRAKPRSTKVIAAEKALDALTDGAKTRAAKKRRAA